MTSFSSDTSASLPGPGWLVDRRRAAFERFSALDLPSAREEIWRYSRIDDLDLDRYQPIVEGERSGDLPDDVRQRIAQVGDAAATVVLANGAVAHLELADELDNKGVVVAPISEIDDGEHLLGRTFVDKGGAIGALHDAFVHDPLVVRIPRGVVVEQPILIVHWVDAEGIAVFPRVVLVAEEDSEVTLVQLQTSSDVASLSVPVTEVDVAQAARVQALTVQETGGRFWQIGHQLSRVDRDARLQTSNVALGGEYARLQIEAALVGKGADADLIAIYFGEGDQVHDFRTKQDHKAPRTRSDLLFKGAVEDRAHSVYSGLIKVRHDAPGTAAFQTNRNITLSPDAWAESVPNLEIEINDVSCSHASAVGPIDEEQRYYLESRGVPPEMAERLIVLGFFDEVIGRLPVAGLRSTLRESVVAKFERRGSAA